MKRIVFTALIIVLLINTFFLQLFWIPTGSMEQTLLIGDRLVVTKYDFWFEKPQRGDIIVFLSADKKRHLIKRIIGLPGEKLKIENNKLYIDDAFREENYIKNSNPVPDFAPVTIPKGHYFVMGDNRNNSSDSRDWGFLQKNLIVGKAKYRYWPINRVGGI